jgi:hypothetical protein
MTEIVNRFAQLIAAILIVRSDFGHGKIGLGESRTRGVNPDENFSNGFNIKVFGKLDYTRMVIDNLAHTFERTKQCILVYARIGFGIVVSTEPLVLIYTTGAFVSNNLEALQQQSEQARSVLASRE